MNDRGHAGELTTAMRITRVSKLLPAYSCRYTAAITPNGITTIDIRITINTVPKMAGNTPAFGIRLTQAVGEELLHLLAPMRQLLGGVHGVRVPGIAHWLSGMVNVWPCMSRSSSASRWRSRFSRRAFGQQLVLPL